MGARNKVGRSSGIKSFRGGRQELHLRPRRAEASVNAIFRKGFLRQSLSVGTASACLISLGTNRCFQSPIRPEEGESLTDDPFHPLAQPMEGALEPDSPASHTGRAGIALISPEPLSKEGSLRSFGLLALVGFAPRLDGRCQKNPIFLRKSSEEDADCFVGYAAHGRAEGLGPHDLAAEPYHPIRRPERDGNDFATSQRLQAHYGSSAYAHVSASALDRAYERFHRDRPPDSSPEVPTTLDVFSIPPEIYTGGVVVPPEHECQTQNQERCHIP